MNSLQFLKAWVVGMVAITVVAMGAVTVLQVQDRELTHKERMARGPAPTAFHVVDEPCRVLASFPDFNGAMDYAFRRVNVPASSVRPLVVTAALPSACGEERVLVGSDDWTP